MKSLKNYAGTCHRSKCNEKDVKKRKKENKKKEKENTKIKDENKTQEKNKCKIF